MPFASRQDAVEVGTSGYTDWFIYDPSESQELVMDSVAYTDGDDTP
jgi:hypothetical protein